MLLRVLINLLPHSFYPGSFLLRSLSILSLALEAFSAKASIDVSLRFVASAKQFVYEASGVAFIEDCHDLFATYESSVLNYVRELAILPVVEP